MPSFPKRKRSPHPLAEQLRGLRQQLGLSQTDVAVDLDLDPSTISYIERGRNNPRLDTLTRIAERYGKRLTLEDV